jgi:hypothetical protein
VGGREAVLGRGSGIGFRALGGMLVLFWYGGKDGLHGSGSRRASGASPVYWGGGGDVRWTVKPTAVPRAMGRRME